MKALPEGCLSGLNIGYANGGIFTNRDVSWRGINVFCPTHKFYYLTGGSCILEFDDKTYRAKKGMWFFIPAGVKHSFYAEEGVVFEKFWLHFSLENGGNNLFSQVVLPRFVMAGDDRKLQSLFKNVFYFAKDESLYGILQLKSSILTLFSYYINLCGDYEIAQNGEGDAELLAVMAYIKQNLNKQISNTDLAQIADMHPNYFVRFFKNKMGITPAKYITTQKMEQAKIMLETTEQPVCDIMLALGYEDMSHFSRLFKHHAGYSPKQYREYFIKKAVFSQ